MENSGILNRPRWSIMRKTQVAVTAFAFLLTAGFVILDASSITTPRSVGALLFGIWVRLMHPSEVIERALGLQSALGLWGFRLLAVSVNSVLGFVFGSALGWLVTTTRPASTWRDR